MPNNIPSNFVLTPEVAQALAMDLPVVALETTVITHGLPQPQNLQLAHDMEKEVRSHSAVPATIGILAGKVHIGLNDDQLERLASGKAPVRKISRRDFGIAIARHEDGGTTVAGTITAAHRVGIRVMATGGIGGVHRNAPFDVSSDLPALGETPIVVVCSGAKAILDLRATLETLETLGVPVVGYQTDELPAFYSRGSGLPVTVSAASPGEVAAIAQAQWEIGIYSAILVVNPPPEEVALPNDEVERAIQEALHEAEQKQIHGAAVTPFLLQRVSEISGGSSLQANLALLVNNARLAASIAVEISQNSKKSLFRV
jgi:pseudouridine-5'-phosphate glycosidase